MPTITLGRRELKVLLGAARGGRAVTLGEANPGSSVSFTPGEAKTFFDKETPGFGVRFSPGRGASYVLHYRPKPGGRNTPKQLFTIGPVDAMSLEAAREAAGDLKAGIRVNGADPAKERRDARLAETLYDLVRAYLDDHVKPDCKATTLALYEGYLRKHIAPRRDYKDAKSPMEAGALGRLKVEAVADDAVNNLRLKLGKTHKRTANAVVTLIAAAYAWGAKKKRLPANIPNPAKSVGRFEENSRERTLNDEEWARLGEALVLAETIGLPRDEPKPGPKAKHAPKKNLMVDKHAVACIRLLALTGCRLREILNLEWAHVDLANKRLNLPDSKTGKKAVPLSEDAIAILTEFQPTNFKYVIAGETAGMEDERPRADLHRPWRRVVKHAKLGALRVHDLRHAYATAALAEHKDIYIVSKMLGHKDIRTTMKYAHLLDEQVRCANNATASATKAKMNARRADVA